jgi:CcmD family protein
MLGVVLGQLPALPLHEAGKYVAGAYVVLFVLVLIYLAIMAVRLRRIERELGDLLEHQQPEPPERPVVASELEVSRPESTLA